MRLYSKAVYFLFPQGLLSPQRATMYFTLYSTALKQWRLRKTVSTKIRAFNSLVLKPGVMHTSSTHTDYYYTRVWVWHCVRCSQQTTGAWRAKRRVPVQPTLL